MVLTRRAGAMVLTRRSGAMLMLAALPAAAAVPELADAERSLVGDAPSVAAGITLRLPPLAENGGQVPVTVAVESAMTPTDHVVAIHLLATRNPTPWVASFRLAPGLARAEVQTRIRLAEDQEVVALAVLGDGSVRRAVAAARVASGGCLS